MAVTDYSVTPGSNTAITGINIAEGCAPSNINNAIRQLMADVRGFYNSTSVLSIIASGDRATARSNLGATATGAALFTAADAAAARTTLGVRQDSMTTTRLLGRTTAGAGAAEEITAGTGLTLATGTLAVSYTRPPDPVDDDDPAPYLWTVADVREVATEEAAGSAVFPTGAYFASSQIAFTLPSGQTAAHGLGATPRLFGGYLVCTTGDVGYSTGDRVNLTGYSAAPGGASVYADGTNIGVRFANAYTIGYKESTGVGAITASSWRLVLWGLE